MIINDIFCPTACQHRLAPQWSFLNAFRLQKIIHFFLFELGIEPRVPGFAFEPTPTDRRLFKHHLDR